MVKTLLLLPVRLLVFIAGLVIRYVVIAAVLAGLVYGGFKYLDKQSMGVEVQPVVVVEDTPSIEDAPWIARTRSRQYLVEEYTEDGSCFVLERYWEKTQAGWVLHTGPFRLDEAFGWYELVPRGRTRGPR